MVVDLTMSNYLRELASLVAPGGLTRQVARGRVVALAKATHFLIQNLLLGRENGLFSRIPSSSSSPERGEAGTDESGYLLTDIFLVALVVAAVVGVVVVLALLGLVLLYKDLLCQLTFEAPQEIFLQVDGQGGPWWLTFC